MPGLVPGIHVILSALNGVDGRDKPGHDDVEEGERATAIVKCDSPAWRGAWRGRVGLRFAAPFVLVVSMVAMVQALLDVIASCSSSVAEHRHPA
ncbi:hypothetical protein ACVILH_001473 [Bradyrhizobium sp. USDA 4353]